MADPRCPNFPDPASICHALQSHHRRLRDGPVRQQIWTSRYSYLQPIRVVAGRADVTERADPADRTSFHGFDPAP